MTDTPIWTPSPERANASRLSALLRWLADEREVVLADSTELHEWSIADPSGFWSAIWDWCGVRGERGETVVQPGADLTETRFFPDARLNVAENLLAGGASGPALIEAGEDGRRRVISWDELRDLVARLAHSLRASGVAPGDRVAAWLPNGPEAIITMLATAAVGGIYSSCSPDFGVSGVLDRFGQIEPTVLVAVDGYVYAGRRHDCSERLAEIRAALPTCRETVLVPYLDGDVEPQAGVVRFDDYLAQAGDEVPTLEFEPMAFDAPWYILYSSGTTGRPKAIVHRAGGVLLKHLVEHRLHCDVRPGDRVFYFTTCGWMMWNWLASGLASGAALVLYDGSPLHPAPTALFDLVDEFGITLFGVSAKFIDAVAAAGVEPRQTHDLSTVRTITSTGSPLAPEGFAAVYADIAEDVHLASISGGTDLCGCLVAGDPTRPVHAGEIQGPGFGMDIDVVDEDGRPVRGEKGELICRNAFPSMPVGFWADDDGSRYRATYFERFPGVWHQGDFASWTDAGGLIIHGRSDATLNPGGVRIGTAEIYRQVERVAGVSEALVIGQRHGDDTRVVLFVVLDPGVTLDDELAATIRAEVRANASPRHVPAVILAVPDIPRTRSGKIVELAVRSVVHGEEVTNTEALANPEALDHFRDRPELA